MKKPLIALLAVFALAGCGAPGKSTSDFDSYLEELMAEPYTADQK